MGRQARSFRRCTGTRDNGSRCKDKAQRHSHFCRNHDQVRAAPRKAPEKRTLLFHLFFMYGYIRYSDVELLKAEVPDTRGAWHHIAQTVFGGAVTNATVQAHANRYKVWMKHNGHTSLAEVTRAIGDLRAPSYSVKFCVSAPRMHTFLRFNEFTLRDLFRYRALIMINGVPYRLEEDGPVRVDEAFVASGIPNNFATLQALDGYTLVDGLRATRPSTACPVLQQECQRKLLMDAVDSPEGALSVPAHSTLAATCIDALDDSTKAWHGHCPRTVDCSHLALAMVVHQPTPVVPEAPEDVEGSNYDFGDMPRLMSDSLQGMEYSSLLEGFGDSLFQPLPTLDVPPRRHRVQCSPPQGSPCSPKTPIFRRRFNVRFRFNCRLRCTIK